MKKKILFLVLAVLLLCTACGKKLNKEKVDVPVVNKTGNFTIDLIKTTRRDTNYLISPYSIEIALNMLKEGANGNTYDEISKTVGSRTINDVSVKNRINVANAIFIKDKYQKVVYKDFTNTLKKDYQAEILYDKFKKPDVINNWVNKNTDGMIKKIIDRMDPDFVLGLANAVAIDVKWDKEFECNQTTKEKFTKANGKKINVEMMHNTYQDSGVKYLEDSNSKGIVLPYLSYDAKTGKENYDSNNHLEFIAIMPNESIDTYLNNLTLKDLNKLIDSGKKSSSKLEIDLSLPRFSYLYEVPNFIEVLKAMGINDAFNPVNADFTKIMAKEDMNNNIYVSEAIHKTYIDLNEQGTKAAAVTYFGLKAFTALITEEPEIIKIEFNKPFIYMIRDSKTKETLFFGSVYEPNLYKGSTCSNEK